MAFSDINMWAGILNESAKEAAAWDKACLEANAELERLEKESYDGIDEEEITYSSLGKKTTTEHEGETLAQIAEKNDVINFDSYLKELDEADEREPLHIAATALDADKASTADLVGQDAVQLRLAKAIEKLSEALDDKKDPKAKETPAPEEKKEKKASDADQEPTDSTDECGITAECDSTKLDAMMGEALKSRAFDKMMREALEDDEDDVGETGIPDADLDKLETMSDEEAVEFLTDQLEGKTPEQKAAIQSIIDTYDLDRYSISKTGFAPVKSELADHIDLNKVNPLLDRANAIVAKYDDEGEITPEERAELDDIVDQLKALETDKNRYNWVIPSFDKATGLPGELHVGPIPAYTSTGREKINDRKRRERAERKSAQEYQRQHPVVPDRGKDEWELDNDWNNKIMTNFFTPREKKEFLMHMRDGATPQEKAVIDRAIKGYVDQRTLGAAWGVSHSAVSAMETKVMDAMLDAMVEVGFMTKNQVIRFKVEDLEQQKKTFELVLERFLSRASDQKIKAFKEELKKWVEKNRNTAFNPKKTDSEEGED